MVSQDPIPNKKKMKERKKRRKLYYHKHFEIYEIEAPIETKSIMDNWPTQDKKQMTLEKETYKTRVMLHTLTLLHTHFSTPFGDF
jgi:hypothetical protein